MVKSRILKALFFNRIVSIALAIHLFNFSIDPRDTAPSYIPENLSINDIESIAEFVCEEVFDLPNAFEETDDADQDIETGNGSILKVYFSSSVLDIKSACISPYCIQYPIIHKTCLDLFKSEITIPPPKVV